MTPIWTHHDRLVAAEIANAVAGGRTICGRQIATITGLARPAVAESIRRLLAAGLVTPAIANPDETPR